MAITMTFYSNFSKRVNSTKQPSGGTAYSVVFKDSFSILGGIVKLKVSFETACNYTEAKYGSKYYTVTDVVSITNDIVEIGLSLDVLATYKSNISVYRCMIERAPVTTNVSLYDDDTIIPKNTFTYTSGGIANIYDLGVCYQVKTQNNQGIMSYFMTLSALEELLISDALAFWEEYLKYVTSILIVPVDISSIQGTTVSEVYLSKQNFNISSGTIKAINSASTSFVYEATKEISSFTFLYDDFRRYSNSYTDLRFIINGATIHIDAKYLRGTSFHISAEMDNNTLDVRIKVEANMGESGKILVCSVNSNVGVSAMITNISTPLSVLSSTVSDIALNTKLDDVKGVMHETATGVTTKVGSYLAKQGALLGVNAAISGGPQSAITGLAGLGAWTGGLVGTAAGGGALVGMVLAKYHKNDLNSINTIPSSGGSAIAAALALSVQFELVQYGSTEKNPDENGYPLLELTTIMSVGIIGYYKFIHADLDISEIEPIKEALNSYLNNGFFYE